MENYLLHPLLGRSVFSVKSKSLFTQCSQRCSEEHLWRSQVETAWQKCTSTYQIWKPCSSVILSIHTCLAPWLCNHALPKSRLYFSIYVCGLMRHLAAGGNIVLQSCVDSVGAVFIHHRYKLKKRNLSWGRGGALLIKRYYQCKAKRGQSGSKPKAPRDPLDDAAANFWSYFNICLKGFAALL